VLDAVAADEADHCHQIFVELSNPG
jgi:hypothetical protein